MPEGTGNGFPIEFINDNAQTFLSREEDERDVTGDNNHKRDLHNIRLPEPMAA
jgi:hypothetical protein